MLQNIEKIVRKQGAIPISLGMIGGNVLIINLCENIDHCWIDKGGSKNTVFFKEEDGLLRSVQC